MDAGTGLAAASASQREVNDLILQFIWAGRRPDEPQVVEDGADVHAPGELDDPRNLAPSARWSFRWPGMEARLFVTNMQP